MAQEMSATTYNRIVAQVWADPDFATRFAARPADVLREQGWNVPAGVSVSVEPSASSSRMVFGLPPKPEGLSLDDFRQPPSATACCCH